MSDTRPETAPKESLAREDSGGAEPVDFNRALASLQAKIAGMYDGMGKPLASVSVSEDGTRLTFAFQDGTKAIFDAEGDCCSRSWIEHLTVPDDISGATITDVLDGRMSQEDIDEGLLQVYNTHFRTSKGDIIVEYRNESNGYYGGYLTRVREASE